MSESFTSKNKQNEVEKFMNPLGFLDEKDSKDYINDKAEEISALKDKNQ